MVVLIADLKQVLFFTLLIHAFNAEESLEAHQMVQSILKSESYSNNIIPDGTPTNSTSKSAAPLTVVMNLAIRDVESLDDIKMEMKLQVSLRQIWTDPRLQYNSSDANDYITLNGDTPLKPWTPDIYMEGEKASAVHNTLRPNSYLRLYPNGTIYYSVRISLKLACPMKLHKFPFDLQTCHVQLSSHGYSTKTMIVIWDKETGVEHTKDSDHLHQFLFIGQKIGNCIARSPSGNYSAVFVELKFKRQLPYYITQFFLPCIMLVLISWVSFWLGSAIEARLSLTVTVLLTMSTQIAGISQGLAPVSYTTGFTIFSGVCLTFAAVPILQTATAFYLGNGSKIFLKPDLEKGMDKEKACFNVAKFDKMSSIVIPISFMAFLTVYFIAYMQGNENMEEYRDNRKEAFSGPVNCLNYKPFT